MKVVCELQSTLKIKKYYYYYNNNFHIIYQMNKESHNDATVL